MKHRQLGNCQSRCDEGNQRNVKIVIYRHVSRRPIRLSHFAKGSQSYLLMIGLVTHQEVLMLGFLKGFFTHYEQLSSVLCIRRTCYQVDRLRR